MTINDVPATDETVLAVSILIVDDEPDMRLLARTVLARAGIMVVGEAENGLAAISKVRDLDPPPVPTVVLLDNRMPGLSGLDVAERILAARPDQLIILFSAFLDRETVAEATRIGVTACVSKADVFRLPEIIRDLVART